MRTIKRLAAFLFFVLLANCSHASLPKYNVSAIVQDEQGYMWFGAHDGLYRFDGHESLHFDEFSEHFSLSNSWVRSLYTQAGELWVGTQSGLNLIDLNAEIAQVFLKDLIITDISPRDENYLWLGTNDGLYLFNKSTRQANQFVKDKTIYKLAMLAGEVYFIDDEGLNKLNQSQEEFELLEPGFFYDLTIDGGSLIAASAQGVFYYTPGLKTLSRVDSDTAAVRLYAGEAGKVFVGTADGKIIPFGSQAKIAANYNYRAEGSSGRIMSLYRDKSGVIWAGSVTGVESITPQHFNEYQSLNKVFQSNEQFITEDSSGNLIIASLREGVAQLNRKDNEVLRSQWITEELGSSLVQAVLSQGNFIWVATTSGLYQFNLSSKTSKHYQHDKHNPHSLSDNFILDISPGLNGQLLIGTNSGGLDIWEPDVGKVASFNVNSHAMISDEVLTALVVSEDEYWLGTAEGVVKLNPLTGSVNNYSLTDKSNAIISSLVVYGDTIYAAAYGKGLFQIDRSSGEVIQHFTNRDGLAGNNVVAMIKHGNDLWLTAKQGISRLDLITKQVQRFDNQTSIIFSTNGLIKTSDNTLCASGVGGVTCWDPQQPYANSFLPNVVLSGVSYDGSRQSIKDHLIADHTVDQITINFASLDFFAPSQNRYQYRIDNGAWVDNSDHKVTLSLPAGSYQFEVKGSNHLGQFSPVTAKIALTVKPHPLLSWQAYTGYVVAGLLLLAFLIWRNSARILGVISSLWGLISIAAVNKEENPELRREIMAKTVVNMQFARDLANSRKRTETSHRYTAPVCKPSANAKKEDVATAG